MGFNAKYTGAQVEELLDKIPTANNIWHSGNFNPYDYLPLSGGTLSSDLTIQNKAVDVITLYRDDANNSPSIKCTNKSDGTLGYIGVSGSGLGIGIQPFFMDSTGTVNKLWHSGNDGSGSGLDADLLDGKQPSELNVGSATKLQTARTIWGQSFDGTSDISGHMTLTTGFDAGGVNMFLVRDKVYVGSIWYNSIWRGINHSFDVNEYTAMTILENGNVGIGTTSPAYKLDVSGDIHASGSVTQNSDINLKNISKDVLISLDDISEAPLFEFTYKNDENKRVHVGTSAQYWVEKNNWFCKKQDNEYYDMEIQNLALASAISIAKEFKKYKEETESTISNMKKEIEELKQIILNMNK